MVNIWHSLPFIPYFLCLPLCAPPAHTQGETTSAISGRIADTAGAPIAGANVIAIGNDDGQKRITRADTAGRFDFPQLKPGTYKVEASAPGFEPAQNRAVEAALGTTATVNL